MNSKLLGFFYRELCIEKSYKINFALKIFSLMFNLVIFYFLCKYISREYFYFLFFGIIFSRIIYYSLLTLNEAIRQEQYWGTIERLILFPGDEVLTHIYLILPKFLFLFIELIAYISIGMLLGISFTLQKLVYLFGFAAIATIVFIGFGLFLAGVILLLKRGDSLGWLTLSLIDILSGVYFPTDALPRQLHGISAILPTTRSLSFFRSLMLESKIDTPDFLFAIVTGILTLPLSVVFFRSVLKIALKKGTLGHY